MNTFNRATVFSDKRRDSQLEMTYEDQMDLSNGIHVQETNLQLFDEYFKDKPHITIQKKFDSDELNHEIHDFLNMYSFNESMFTTYLMIVDYRFFIKIAKSDEDLVLYNNRLKELTDKLNGE